MIIDDNKGIQKIFNLKLTKHKDEYQHTDPRQPNQYSDSCNNYPITVLVLVSHPHWANHKPHKLKYKQHQLYIEDLCYTSAWTAVFNTTLQTES